MYRYKTVKIDGKTKLLHRHIMEQHLGRVLLRSEHVHHRNGDRYDNRIENLQVLSAKEHQHGHKQKHPERKRCVVCGKIFTPAPTKRKRSLACALNPCGRKLLWMRRKGEQPPFSPDIAAALVRANFAASATQEAA